MNEPYTELHERIAEVAYERVLAEQRVIEWDLGLLLSWRINLPDFLIRRIGYTVVHQVPPWGGDPIYRGISQRGKMVTDHHPEWGDLQWRA